MTVEFPGKICEKAIAKNHHAIQCDSCGLWVHSKCSGINPQTDMHLQNRNARWYYINCFSNIISFSKLSN